MTKKKTGFALRTQTAEGRDFTQLVDASTGTAIAGVSNLKVDATDDGQANTVTATMILTNVPTFEEPQPAPDSAAEASDASTGGSTRRGASTAPAGETSA